MASALETLCGQAFGSKRLYMLGFFVQRSLVVLFICCVILLPVYIWVGPILKLLGLPDDVANETQLVALWMIPYHFSFAFYFPLQSWLLVYVIPLGVVGLAIALDVAWWAMGLGLFAYTAFGWCPETWGGFSLQAFSGLWEFAKLSVASVRVANELGAGDGKAAKFAAKVSVTQSNIIGLIFVVLILIFYDKYGLMFTNSSSVVEGANKLATLLAISVLLNGIQPVLSGVAVGSSWQTWVAYINVACYCIVGISLGTVMGWVFPRRCFGFMGWNDVWRNFSPDVDIVSYNRTI
ncbi:hypothetical protein Ancab_036471 [Ancistrocladus abbreviatus]